LTLAVDRERGVILRFEAGAGGEPIRRLEVEEIAFDEPLSDDLFAQPAGEVRSAHEAFPVRYVTLEQAARDASFELLSPARLAVVPEHVGSIQAALEAERCRGSSTPRRLGWICTVTRHSAGAAGANSLVGLLIAAGR
jgi:hypothetical protein